MVAIFSLDPSVIVTVFLVLFGLLTLVPAPFPSPGGLVVSMIQINSFRKITHLLALGSYPSSRLPINVLWKESCLGIGAFKLMGPVRLELEEAHLELEVVQSVVGSRVGPPCILSTIDHRL